MLPSAYHAIYKILYEAKKIFSNLILFGCLFKLLCRTSIALEQEKVIERNTKEIYDIKREKDTLKEHLDKIKQEFDTLKEKNELNEQALKDRDDTIKYNNMGMLYCFTFKLMNLY